MGTILLGSTNSPYIAAYDSDTLIEGTTPSYSGLGIAGIRFNAARDKVALCSKDSATSNWGIEIRSWPDFTILDSVYVSPTTPVPNPVQWSPDESKIAFANAGLLNVYDATDLSATPDSINPSVSIKGFAWAGETKMVLGLNTGTNQDRVTVYDIATGSPTASQPSHGVNSTVQFLTSSADYVVIGAVGTVDLCVLDATSPSTVVGTVEGDITSGSASCIYDGTIYVIDGADNLHSVTPAGVATEINNTLSFSNSRDIATDGNFIVIGGAGSGNDLAITDMSGTLQTFSQPASLTTVNGVAFSTGGTASTPNLVEPDATEKNEGDTLTYTLSNFETDGTYYYEITGTVDYNDFSSIDGVSRTQVEIPEGIPLTGTVTVTSGSGSLPMVLRDDVTTEGSETVILKIYSDEALTTLVSTADTVTVSDTSTYTAYSMTPDETAIEVGDLITYTLASDDTSSHDVVVMLMANSTVTPGELGLLTDAALINEDTSGYVGEAAMASGAGSVVIDTANVSAGVEKSIAMAIYNGNPGEGGTLLALAPLVFVAADELAALTIYASPDITEANADDDVDFTITASGPDGTYDLYWSTSGNAIAGDFDDTTLTGSFSITISGGTGSATVTRPVSSSAPDAGVALFALQVRANATDGPIKVTSPKVIIKSSDVAGYSIAGDISNPSEGQTVVFSGTAVGEADSTTLYYSIQGGYVAAADFDPANLTGTTTVTSEAYSFNVTIDIDDLAEGTEDFIVTLRSGSATGSVLATSQLISIQEGELAIFNDKTNLTEDSDTLTATVKGTNVPDGTVYYWEILGSATADDFSTAVSGTVTINSGTGTITLTTEPDEETEVGGESFIILLRAGSASGEVVATSPLVIIGDTSVPAPTYAITANDAAVNEDQGAQFTVLITGYPNATTFGYSTTGDVTAADFDDQSLTGTFQVFGDELAAIGTITRTISADRTTEGDETFKLQVRIGSETGPVVATSQTVTITDTSIGDPSYSASASDSSLYEDDTTTITVDGTNVGEVTVYWDIFLGDVTADDFSPAALSGTVDLTGTIASSSGDFDLTIATGDAALEDEATFYVGIRETSNGPIVAQVGPITILHPSYALALSTTELAEGGTLTITANTSNVPNGTVLYAVLSGDVAGADFDEATLIGEITITGNSGQTTFTASEDYLSEDDESFVVELHTGSAVGPLVATSATVTLVDASYSVAVDVNYIEEGETVTFTATFANAPDGTYYWTLASDSTATGADFSDSNSSGSFTVTGGTGTITRTALADITADGAEFFWLEIREGSTSGTVLAITPAVLIVEPEPAADPWIDETANVTLIEMDHSAGTVYIATAPYIASSADTNPNQGYDDLIFGEVEYEVRIDQSFELGGLSVALCELTTDWPSYKWRGYPIRLYGGALSDARDDFTAIGYAINGGIAGGDISSIEFATYDGMAVFDQPLQDTFLSDGKPVPLCFGSPFNITPAVTNTGTKEHQVHDGAILSVQPKLNGADVLSGDDHANGKFQLSGSAAGIVTADPVTPLSTAAMIIAWACAQKSVAVVGATLAALPTYPLGIYYDDTATLDDLLADVCTSVDAHWHRDYLGRVQIFEKSTPKVTADLELTVDDILADSLELISVQEPAKSITVNYNRNYTPTDKDALAGVIQSDPAQAELLSQEWSKKVVENVVSDYPLAQDLVINTQLIDGDDATTLGTKKAGIRSQRRYTYGLTVFLNAGAIRPGMTLEITYPYSDGQNDFSAGINAVVLSARPRFVAQEYDLEVWF